MAMRPSSSSSQVSQDFNEHHGLKVSNMANVYPTPEDNPLQEFAGDVSFSAILPSLQPIVEPTTPVTPVLRTFTSSSEIGLSQRDHALYPDHNTTEAAVQDSLFRPSSSASHSVSPTPLGAPVVNLVPTAVAVNCPATKGSNPVKLLNQYGMQYWEFCMNEINEIRAAQRKLPPATPSKANKRDGVSRHQLALVDRVGARVGRFSRITKSKLPGSAVKPVKAATSTPAVRSTSPVKRAPPANRGRKTVTPNPRAGTPDAKPRTRAPASKKNGPPPDAWATFADVCPPTASLDQATKSLLAPEHKIPKPLDLSKDANRQHLDARELELASHLRLPCNTYLLSKRQIFAHKLQWLKDVKAGKEVKGEFNKTAAQNACQIDVNKCSKLWVAFDRVGWFEAHWFEKYL